MNNRPKIEPDQLLAPNQLLAPQWLLLPEGPRRGQAVLVADGRFVEVGPLPLLQSRHPDHQVLYLDSQLLMPGFIDTHHHLSQSFGKGLVFGEPSEIFRRIWVPLEGSLNADLLYLTAKLAALEALRGGFTTVCDAGTRAEEGLDAIAKATGEAGIRCVLARVCNDKRGVQILDSGPILAQAERHLAQWESDPLITPSLAIPIPEIATDTTLAAVYGLCAEAGRVFQTHVNEHLVAVERSLEHCGLRPLEQLHRAGALGPAALLAHATLLTPHELILLRDSGAAVSYNPVASAWKGNAVAQALLMHELGIPLGLGTDGTRGDGFRLLDYAEAAQRFAHGIAVGDSVCGGGSLWLDMATQSGAQVTGLNDVTGRIAPGLAADFLLVDLDVPELIPSWDLSWELVRLVNRDQIQAVVVQGRLRLWQGWPTDWDARALMREVDALARDVVAQAPIHKVNPSPLVR
ncbi:amidohydrolase family protein [Pseudomonas stutzeri]|uniref:amidohydrolase family protein n=1 Tax=Stutzerimonas stutzeri TaxID=316 RepID=UPI002108A1B7|nr:amidohydrolase family protein [Stutzerimonas stutzeri]MCQ4314149.1 amidohydrolase family protein [Stutzerimonas stutzeri]